MIILCNNLDNTTKGVGTCTKKRLCSTFRSRTNVNTDCDKNFSKESRNTLITNVNYCNNLN